MSTEAEVTPPVEDAPPPAEAAAPPDEVEQQQDDDIIKIPDSSEEGGAAVYVRGSALAGARKEIKELRNELADAKTTASRATELEQKIAQLEGTLNQYAPVVQAYQAMQQAQQTAPPQDAHDPEAEAFAREMDLYTPDGQPDIARAQKVLERFDKRAQATAQKHVQPLAQHTVNQQSQAMLSRALNTFNADGEAPDPAVLKAVWSQMDPGLVATKEGALNVWQWALGATPASQRVKKGGGQAAPAQGATRGADGKFVAAQTLPPPQHVERSGGHDGPANTPMSESERKTAKTLGLSEKEYMDMAKNAPWLR